MRPSRRNLHSVWKMRAAFCTRTGTTAAARFFGGERCSRPWSRPAAATQASIRRESHAMLETPRRYRTTTTTTRATGNDWFSQCHPDCGWWRWSHVPHPHAHSMTNACQPALNYSFAGNKTVPAPYISMSPISPGSRLTCSAAVDLAHPARTFHTRSPEPFFVCPCRLFVHLRIASNPTPCACVCVKALGCARALSHQQTSTSHRRDGRRWRWAATATPSPEKLIR